MGQRPHGAPAAGRFPRLIHDSPHIARIRTNVRISGYDGMRHAGHGGVPVATIVDGRGVRPHTPAQVDGGRIRALAYGAQQSAEHEGEPGDGYADESR